MQNAQLGIPAMYADHHVTRVRNLLLSLSGVIGVQASAAARQVSVTYDEAVTSPEAFVDALAAAGYSPDAQPTIADLPKQHEDGSAWYTLIDRTTVTEFKDRQMAGDFRRY